MASELVVGIFVGGRGRRMGGRDKSQLPAPGGQGTLLSRWLGVIAQAGIGDPVLVGGEGDAPCPRLQDDPPGIGPLGGLHALLKHAGDRPAIAVATDMPYVDAALLRRLASEQPGAPVLAARDPQSRKWQSMFARYAPGACAAVDSAISQDRRSLQHLFGELAAQELTLSADEHAKLGDWDTPEDVDA